MADGAFRIPITVSRSNESTVLSANVCFGNEGPFAFVIDTGASPSVIDFHLAKRLHLLSAGSASRYFGAGCSGTTRPESVVSWSVAGLVLAPQTVAVQAIPGFGGQGEPDGLIGADALSRFGALRIDFASHTLTVPSEQGPPPTSQGLVSGPGPSPLPSALTGGPEGTVVDLRVAEGPGYAVAVTDLYFPPARRSLVFALDTGSSRSLVDSSLVGQLRLTRTNLEDRVSTVCSTGVTKLVRSGDWEAGPVTLPDSLLADMSLGQVSRSGIDGLLGSDVLSRFSYSTIDFRGARLVLGPLLEAGQSAKSSQRRRTTPLRRRAHPAPAMA
jgi:hypothetical protein